MASVRDAFFQSVVDAVKQLQDDAFSSFESEVLRLVKLTTPAERARFEEAVDTVVLKVEEATEKSLAQWQAYCEADCFQPPPEDTTAAPEETPEETGSHYPEPGELAKEAELDAELASLRSRILAVRRDKVKLQNECVTLEAWLNTKREKVNAVSFAASQFSDSNVSTIAEIAKASSRLRERLKQLEEAAQVNTFSGPIEDASRTKAAVAKLLRDSI